MGWGREWDGCYALRVGMIHDITSKSRLVRKVTECSIINCVIIEFI